MNGDNVVEKHLRCLPLNDLFGLIFSTPLVPFVASTYLLCYFYLLPTTLHVRINSVSNLYLNEVIQLDADEVCLINSLSEKIDSRMTTILIVSILN